MVCILLCGLSLGALQGRAQSKAYLCLCSLSPGVPWEGFREKICQFHCVVCLLVHSEKGPRWRLRYFPGTLLRVHQDRDRQVSRRREGTTREWWRNVLLAANWHSYVCISTCIINMSTIPYTPLILFHFHQLQIMLVKCCEVPDEVCPIQWRSWSHIRGSTVSYIATLCRVTEKKV